MQRDRAVRQGRTLTHEIGHWLNLRHIWGDTLDRRAVTAFRNANCEGPNISKPTLLVITCSNATHGDMFMNYMDYGNDTAMFMSTAGQVWQISACLAGPRKSFSGA